MLPAVSTSTHAPPPPRLTYACHLLVLVQVRCNSAAPSSCGRGETIAPLRLPHTSWPLEAYRHCCHLLRPKLYVILLRILIYRFTKY
jgi:hypothetical protein